MTRDACVRRVIFGRWDTIQHAGQRDTKERTLFDKIIAKELPSTIVFEDDRVMAFRSVEESPDRPCLELVRTPMPSRDCD